MPTAPKKVINAWAMYDWANSVYNLVITTTFFPIYFLAVTRNGDNHTVRFLGRDFVNSSLYDYTLATAYLLIAFSYPVLTSIADSRGNKKNFMRFFCYMGALGCSSLFFFNASNLWLGVLAFMMAAMGFVGSLVFYNAYLPEIAAPEDRDRISAKGFSYGYIGSVVMQLIGFALVTLMSDQGLATRITFLLVGIWWVGFAQISFASLPDSKPAVHKSGENVFTAGFRAFGNVWAQVKKHGVLKSYLLSFFFYSMGVQTVMLAATLFGSKVLNLPDTNLILTIVIIQLVAIAGAVFIAKFSNRFGNIKVLMGTVFFWIIICIAAYTVAGLAERGVNAENYFYGLAVGVGLVMGGIQSLSRSTYSKLMPETNDTASFFSFYDTTEKVAIVIGMISFGLIDERLGMKNSVLSLVVFFFIGLIGLFFTLQKQKRAA
jgi:UMF1 family MFS transporter